MAKIKDEDIYIPSPRPIYWNERIIINKIEINNFKSFSGWKTVGPFHHNANAITGSSGYGKTNAIESVLFVFGFRPNKIRCKHISQLINNVNYHASCSVAVHFYKVEGEDGTRVPGSEFVIKRTAFHDNSSIYTINGERKQFIEVAELLKQNNVDLDHNRFILLQSEFESIDKMKPKAQDGNETGILEYLEDIVDTSRYIEPLAKIHRRVEELIEERIEKYNQCKYAEWDMKDLEEPYNVAVEYLRQENEKTRTLNLYIQKHLSDTQKQLEELVVKHESLSTEMKEHDELAGKLEEKRKEKENALREETAMPTISRKRVLGVQNCNIAKRKCFSSSSGIEKEESEMKLKRVEIEQKLQAASKSLNDVRAKILHWLWTSKIYQTSQIVLRNSKKIRNLF